MASRTSPPPILRLPVELHKDIIDLLQLSERALLSVSCRYFAYAIKKPTFDDFLEAEASEWATTKALYVCKGCARFQPLLHFSDDMRKGKRCRSGVDANTRFCVKCGVDREWYPFGTELSIMGRSHVVCKHCKIFTDQVGSTGSCASCSPKKPKRIIRPSFDDWEYSVNSYIGDRHIDELYGVWPDT
ncbi:F-box domain-containing protein [Lophiostoma macrostomum CBS 122681]|uniref:F-box domain-containing protein n=1 Tax=Lophiostoma macrostomum CBS 122681 TaxID=1314788 RepID=A0A6A6TJ09_9PLEO|nr:F-box domain-containing protein [Lophiostoma macrostomum CBS 122681]